MGIKQQDLMGITTRTLLDRVRPRIDRRLQDSVQPFDRTDLFRPHVSSRRWGWTHFGVFLPDLPAPYRYLNTMTLIGAMGTVCFDNDELAAPDARNTTTVLSSTAFADLVHYESYDAIAGCDFAEDGSSLKWGEDLTMRLALPQVSVDADYAAFAAHIELTTTSTVSYFIRTPIYEHLSLLAPYQVTLTDATGTHEYAGLGAVEYARCMTPQVLRRSPLPASLKVPADFFTYQIINLDPDTQLLLTDVRGAGATGCLLAHLRTRDGRAEVFTDVRFEVLEHGEDLVDPWDRSMRAPYRMRWTVRDSGAELIRLDATVDAPWRFGHGRGYVSAYQYDGQWAGKDITGSGYIEWIDCESDRLQ